MSLAPVVTDISEGDWIRFKEEIRRLYLTEGRKLEGEGGVRNEMKKWYNFDQTNWRFRKNIKRTDWEIVKQKVSKRKQAGKDSDVYIDGALVPARKLRKELRRYGTASSSQLAEQGTTLTQIAHLGIQLPLAATPEPQTPDGVSVCTPVSIGDPQNEDQEISAVPHMEDSASQALQTGHASLVGSFLDRGLDPNLAIYLEQHHVQRTPLEIACEMKDLELVRLLISKGADVEKSSSGSGEEETSPLVRAINGKDDFFYIPKGARENEFVTIQIVKTLLDAGADVNDTSTSYVLPLVEAAAKGFEVVIYLLLDNGADVNLRSLYGHLALETVLLYHFFYSPGRMLRVVKRLVEAGANVNPDGLLIEPLTLAAQTGSLKLFKFLYFAGARPGSWTLAYVVDSRRNDLVRFALDAGIVGTVCPAWCIPALILAISRYNIERFQCLFNSDAVQRGIGTLARRLADALRSGIHDTIPQLMSPARTDMAFVNNLNPEIRAAITAWNSAVANLSVLGERGSGSVDAISTALKNLAHHWCLSSSRTAASYGHAYGDDKDSSTYGSSGDDDGISDLEPREEESRQEYRTRRCRNLARLFYDEMSSQC
ncbi:MAG: hypothetical protein Q9157_005728 [Trypethelium eluteriae]